MSIYYLYIKTHLKTGLKYLGYTSEKDPYEYKGSGKHWKRHIAKHGNDIWTNVIFQTEIKEEITLIGTYYSKLWNVVESKEWANLKPETGSGGGYIISEETKAKIAATKIGKRHTEQSKEKMAAIKRGKIHTDETKAKIAAAHLGKKHTAETKAKMSIDRRGKNRNDQIENTP